MYVDYFNWQLFDNKAVFRTLINCSYPTLHVILNSFLRKNIAKKNDKSHFFFLFSVVVILSYQRSRPYKKGAEQPNAQEFSNLPTNCSHDFGERVTLKWWMFVLIRAPSAQTLFIVCKKVIHFSANENWNLDCIMPFFLINVAWSGAVWLV